MNRAMLNHLVFIVFVACSLAAHARPQSGRSTSPLVQSPLVEGTRWTVTLTSADTGAITTEDLRHVLVFEKSSRAALRQMPSLDFAPTTWTKRDVGEGKSGFAVTFTSEFEGTIVMTGEVSGSKKSAAVSGSATWTRGDSKTAFEFTGKPAAEFEGTSWALGITPRPLPDEEEADEPFEEILTFFDGKAWLSSDSLVETAPAPYAVKTADGSREIKVTLKDDTDTVVLTCKVTGQKLAGTIVWRDEDSTLLDAKVVGLPRK